jgi:tetratricopeptide (TPR) repeat protein
MHARKLLGRAFRQAPPRRRLGTWFALLCLMAGATLGLPARAAEKNRIEVSDYRIEATINPEKHHLWARAQVKFSALDDISIAIFELHNDLRPTKVSDAEGHAMQVERVSQDSTIRIPLPNGLQKGQTETLNFEYEGDLISAEDSPVAGLKLAYVGDPSSYLLYAGRWFPVVGYGTNRFTATIRVTVPAGYTVAGSGGNPSAPGAAAAAPAQNPGASGESGKPPLRARSGELARKTGAPPAESAAAKLTGAQAIYSFAWDKPSFPGTLVIGKFEDTAINAGGLVVHVLFPAGHKQQAQEYGEVAGKEFNYFTTLYGVPMSTELKVVELPDDTVPAAWAPEMAAISSRVVGGKLNYRLLANLIAHQWWGVAVSPATRNDWWVTDGLARYAETQYVEHVSGKGGEEEAVKDMAVGALAYDAVPLGQLGSLEPFDPGFQSLAADKGGMVFHMLHWVIGEQNFDQLTRRLAQQFQAKPVSVDDLEKLADQTAGEKLAWFFAQWLDSTGAPEFKNKYTIYRTNKGFRIVGEIQQDLDLFRMPVEIKIDTDGQSETKKVDVVGTNSAYALETYGKPRHIVIDPDNEVLKNTPELRLRTAILRGQQMVQQGNLAESLKEFQKALDINKSSSLAHYRVAEVFFMQRNYQASANAYRDALNGDGEPKWTEVWCHIQLGKIFDVSGQRERAVNEYQQALQTQDNTQGALDEARKYLQTPFTRSKEANGM